MIAEPIIAFYQAIMRPEWVELTLGNARQFWERSSQRFLSTIMGPHFESLCRARDLLAVKGYDTSKTVLTCYSGAGFDADLRASAATDPQVLLVDLPKLYG